MIARSSVDLPTPEAPASTTNSPALAIAWGAADLIYFIASFGALGLQQFVRVPGADVAIEHANDWMFHYILFPAMGLREAMLLVVVVWGVWQIRQRVQPALTGQVV